MGYLDGIGMADCNGLGPVQQGRGPGAKRDALPARP